MQSTGVYWIPLYDALEEAGMEVYLVNAKSTKNLPGRKSDVQECQWLLKLHTYGLLRNSFRPPAEIRQLRAYWRLRDRHVKDGGRAIQWMQKALTQMNLQLANVISDLSGWTGLKIIRAILAGERDAHKLAALRDGRIRASEEEIVKSLQGTWREELLFELQQALQTYDFCQSQICECDQKLEQQLKTLPGKVVATKAEEPAAAAQARSKSRPKPKRKKARGNAPEFGLDAELQRITGVNVARVDGIDVMTIQTVISEVGVDMSPWKTERHFTSWLGLCPYQDISGGKVLKTGTRRVKNRAACAFRLAAATLRRSQSYLGAQFRRFRARLGPAKATTAMARKLAVIFYKMMKFGQEYVDQGAEFYEEKYRQHEFRLLLRTASRLGLQIQFPATPE